MNAKIGVSPPHRANPKILNAKKGSGNTAFFCGVEGKNMSNLKFYTITDEYVNFLRNIDSKIQANYPAPQIKPYVGIIITMDIHQYFAPLSSYKTWKHDKINNNTIFKIYNRKGTKKLSVLHLNNMFPIIPSEISFLDFNQVQDQKYRNLLRDEYHFVINNQEAIRNRAEKLYNDVKKGDQFYCKYSCDFAKLEEEYIKFGK